MADVRSARRAAPRCGTDRPDLPPYWRRSPAPAAFRGGLGAVHAFPPRPPHLGGHHPLAGDASGSGRPSGRPRTAGRDGVRARPPGFPDRAGGRRPRRRRARARAARRPGRRVGLRALGASRPRGAGRVAAHRRRHDTGAVAAIRGEPPATRGVGSLTVPALAAGGRQPAVRGGHPQPDSGALPTAYHAEWRTAYASLDRWSDTRA